MKTAEEVLKNNLIGTVVDGSRPVSEKDWEEGKEVGAHVPFLKAMIEYSSLQNRSLVEENERLKNVLRECHDVLCQFDPRLSGMCYNPGSLDKCECTLCKINTLSSGEGKDA